MTDELEERALALIKSKPRGILQSELWKDLEIDSRKCSRVVAKLESEGKVKRTWETVSGTRTYRLSYVETKKEAPKKEYRFDLILAEDEVAPCVGCTYECEPDYCPDLGLWIELLAKEEARRPSKAPAKAVEEPEVAAPEEVEAPAAKPAKAARAPKKGKAAPPPEPEEEKEEVPVRPARARKGKAAPPPEPEEEEEEEEAPVRHARKGKKAAEPEAPVKMAKTATPKGKAKPEPEEEEEEEKPAPKRKAAPRAQEEKEEKKAPARKRK